jgi:hypothetical protein
MVFAQKALQENCVEINTAIEKLTQNSPIVHIEYLQIRTMESRKPSRNHCARPEIIRGL